MLADTLSRYWWATLLRGAMWILFGIVALAQPLLSLVALTFMFGGLALADGVTNIGTAIRGRNSDDSSWIPMITGIAGVGVGLITLFSPQVTGVALLFYIAIWAIVNGLFAIVTAVRLHKEMEGEFWLGLGGLVSVAFGVFVLARPGAGALSILWLIGTYAIVFGLILVVAAVEMRWIVRAANRLRS
jgi:uncharacterized membrane protein HdeD (DUF308 family)